MKNEADYNSKSIGAEYHHYGSYDKMSRQEKNKVYNTIGLSPSLSMPAKGDANSTTSSAVARGTIDIRENPTQDISALNRDTNNALNELGRIFDKQKIEEQQELAKTFGEEAFRLAHNLPDDGSGRKIAVHAIIGGIMSQITGAGFASGAIGAGVNEAVIGEIKKIKDPGTAQIVSAIVGAAAAKAVGGNAGAGASAAASGTKNNWLGKEQETFVEELSEALESQDQEKINEVLAKYYALSNYYDQHGMTGEGDDQRITASLYPLLECLIPEDKRYWLDGGLNYTLNNIVCMDPALFALANQKRHDLEVNGYAEDVIPSNDYRVAERAAEIKMNSEIPKTNYATEESSAAAKAVGIATDLVAAKVLSYGLPLTPSAYLYARYGEGESLNFSEDSVVSYEIVHSQDFIEEIRTRGRDIPLGSSETRFMSVKMNASGGIDQWLTFGTIKLAITITHNMDNTYTVEGVAEDLYNFEHLTLDGWKKIVEIGNNIAYDLQKKGEVRPYTWKANIHATIHE